MGLKIFLGSHFYDSMEPELVGSLIASPTGSATPSNPVTFCCQ
jgi:hypothetical protein